MSEWEFKTSPPIVVFVHFGDHRIRVDLIESYFAPWEGCPDTTVTTTSGREYVAHVKLADFETRLRDAYLGAPAERSP